MKISSLRYSLILLVALCASGTTSCSKKPLTKEEATKQIITDVLDNCKGGKNSEVASQMDRIMPDEEKKRMKKDKIDYANADDKKQVDRLCQGINEKYGNGYEFGKFISQAKGDGSEVLGWEFFPKGGQEGQVWAFKLQNDKYMLVDIDPAKR